MIVLDTNIVSAVLRLESAVTDRLLSYPPGDVVVPTPVLAEIEFGLQRLPPSSRRRHLLAAELASLLRLVRVEPWSQAAAVQFGQVKAELEALGTPIEDMDVAIASCALTLGAALVTRNVRHFERVPNLAIERW